MLEDLLLLAFCAVVALGGLMVVVWEAVTGALFSIDGLWLTLISLTLAVVFGGNVAWSVHTGEVRHLLDQLTKGSRKGGTSD